MLHRTLDMSLMLGKHIAVNKKKEILPTERVLFIKKKYCSKLLFCYYSS